MYVSAELRPSENASKKMETDKTATANKGDVYSQDRKKDEKGTLYNPLLIQLRGDGK